MHHVLAALAASGIGLALAQGVGPERSAAAELATRAVMQRFSLPADAIRLVEVTDASWRDSSLGCPEKGMVYTPATVQGHVVVLDAAQPGGRIRHRVHVAGGRAVICPASASSASRDLKLPPADNAAGLRAAERARSDLALRLKVDRAQIDIERFRTTVWPDASLGCPAPAAAGETKTVSGFTIFLSYGGKTYEYHADATRTLLMPGC